MPHRSFLRSLSAIGLITMAVGACQDDARDPVQLETDVDPRPEIPTVTQSSLDLEGYPTVGEIRHGYIRGWDGQPTRVVYEIHDGLAIWEGDVVLGEADEIPSTPAELAASGQDGPLRGVVIDDNSKRWPGGVVPWQNSDADPAIVAAAVEMIEDETPGIDMVPYTGSEPNYITFRDASGCSSPIGMQGGEQFINLKVNDGVSFCSAGSGAHEILHALGMYHEHTRCDRDSFVTIDYAEIESGKEHNFYKAGSDAQGDPCGDDTAVFDIGSYDPGSIMHYGQFAFAVGSNPTINPLPGVDGSVMGQRSALGPTDVETVDVLYGTNNAAPVAVIAPLAPSYPEGSTVPFDGGASTDADDALDVLSYAWTFGDGTCAGPAICSEISPDKAYGDDGSYAVTLTVSDGFDEGNAAAVANIVNVAPTVSVGPDATIDEGDLFARAGTFTDPGTDTWSATVDYGDGSGVSALALAGMSFDLSHTYVDDGVNVVTVTVDDDDGGSGSDDATVTVENVAPTVDAGADATVESGETFDFSGSFSDPGIEDDPWAWVIDWGFGDDTDGSTSDQAAPIVASRQVCVAGDYVVELSVTDKDDGTGTDQLVLTVPYVSVDIDIMPGSPLNPVKLGRRGNLPVAILGSMDLDVTEIDPATLVLGDESGTDTPLAQKNNGTLEAYVEDVNGDGYPDLVAMFEVPALEDNGDLDALSTELVLRGFQDDGCTNFRGSDVVSPQ